MKRFHIAFTGVGRRIELIQALREAALKLHVELKIFGLDLLGNAPALAYCDYTRRVCRMNDANYIPELLKICENDKIDMLIPTIDTDLLVLSKHKSEFEAIGTKVLISAPDKILICRDKNNTGAFFESCGCKAPKTYNNYLEYNDSFPCFIKPKDGSSSINAFKVESRDDLAVYANQVEDYIIQPFVSGREYTIDIFGDYDGNPVYVTPRERLQVRAGEVLKTQICNDAKMTEEALRIVEAFKPCGAMTVQLIRDAQTGDDYFIEINPRFGGGSPLSMKAGAKSAEAVIKILLGEKLEYVKDAATDNAVYSRFDQSVCIDYGDNDKTVEGVIFDLDDTLYGERAYVRTGYEAIEQYLGIKGAADKLWEYFEQKKNAIDCYLESIGDLNSKDKCLETYRTHKPVIMLYDGVYEMISELKAKGIKIGIITDGRVDGQTNKIEALGLDKLADDIIITDSLGGEQFRKPCDIAFRIMQNRWRLSAQSMIYIGDNASKDFVAPKELGMQWLHFKNADGIYYRPLDEAVYEVSSIAEMRETLDRITK